MTDTTSTAIDGAQPDNHEEVDVHEEVEHTKTGVELSLESKRGTGTRDQDAVSAKIRGKTLEEVDAQREAAREMVIEEMNALRENQPDADDGDSESE